MIQIPKCTLVPACLYDEAVPGCFLSQIVGLEDSEQVSSIPVPEYKAVFVYAGNEIPELYTVLCKLQCCPDYIKILASVKDEWLHMAIAKGKDLVFANIFHAPAFNTVEYFIFSTLKSLQLNLEMSTVCFLSPLTQEQEMSLYRYVKFVEHVK